MFSTGPVSAPQKPLPTPQTLANPASFLHMGRPRPREESRVKKRYHHQSDGDGMKRVSESMKTVQPTSIKLIDGAGSEKRQVMSSETVLFETRFFEGKPGIYLFK